MKKNLLVFLLGLLSFHLQAADYYWVGGGGNWSDLNHWRLGSSTGSIPSIVPATGDNVFFDANSGFGTTTESRTVVLNANGFCNNMTWGAVANNPVFSRTGTYRLEVWGNLFLSPNVTHLISIVFRGSTDATLATNGPVAGGFAFEVSKPGSTLQLVDSFVCTSGNAINNIVLTEGTLDFTGKKITTLQVNSSGSGIRTLNMGNATLNLSYRWVFNGTNKTLNAAGSYLYAGVYLFTAGDTYHEVACNGLDNNNFGINNSTFTKLTFTRVSSASYAQLTSGNTVDTLIFKGTGRIYDNNTVQHVEFEGQGNILGTGNTVHYASVLGSFSIASGTATNTFDTLLLAANKTASFTGTIYLNKYLRVEGLPCDAFTELTGDSTRMNMIFAAGASADIDNVLLTGMQVSGPITPIAVTGIDGEGNDGFTITPPASAAGTTLYWVGGSGDWNNNAHWSYTSGGAGGACIPFINDDVIFDGNSGLVAGNNTVTTNANSYCHNLTWDATLGTATFNESSSGILRVYGAAILNPAVTMNAGLEFNGEDPASAITFNGSTLGTLSIVVRKPGTGALTLVDNWSNANGLINLYEGYLNMPDRTISIQTFISNVASAIKHLDIRNAQVTVSTRWEYTGQSKYIESEGSHITSNYVFIANGLTYPAVELTYAGGNSAFNITGTTIGQLSFTSASATSVARVGGSNIIRRLEFSGAGAVAAGGNVIDSLLLAGSRNYQFVGSNSIGKYLKALSPACSGLSEIKGIPSATLVFASTATVEMDNVYLQNMTASGIGPITVSGADAGGNSGWVINAAPAGSRYWVGGSGDWNDGSHWASNSGGAGGACIPTVYDNVYFDAGSGFTSADRTVTISNGNAYCHNLSWASSPNNPVWTKSASWNIEVWGSIVLNPGATFNVSPVIMKGNDDVTIQGGSVSGNFDVFIDKNGGSVTLGSDYSNTQTDIVVNSGAFNAAGRVLTVRSIDNSGLNNPMNIDITDATVTVSAYWRYNGGVSNRGLSAANSTINTPEFLANGFTYAHVNVSGASSNQATLSNTVVDKLIFTNTSTSSAIGINGTNNVLGTVDYKGSGGIYGTGNVIDTLIFFPGNTYTLNNGTNTTINGAWYGSGSPCRLTEIVSSSTSANATITKNGSEVSFDYVRLRRITAAGTAGTFTVGEHSANLGNNVNWNIAPYNGAAPISGLGNDLELTSSDFPYTLHTEGFFGSPSSSYLWNDNSTLDSLVITGTGTYSVTVSFPDGCAISDEIVVSPPSTLPVTLTEFKVRQQDCQAILSWKVEDAIHFSHFIVEKSVDGRSFREINRLTYTGAARYAYTDPKPGNGTVYYRLKMVDVDESHTYSPWAALSLHCGDQQVQVSPTFTASQVNVTLPAGWGQAKILVYNAAGQQVKASVTGSGNLRTVNLVSLVSGVYLLQVMNGSESRVYKVSRQ